jgi:DNA-binding CsgD family transcriptional regulator
VVGEVARPYALGTVPDVESPVLSSWMARLTPREIEVLRRTATGRTNADVAADLGVTIHAVKFHLASIFKKLGVHNRTEATARYLQLAATEVGEETAAG